MKWVKYSKIKPPEKSMILVFCKCKEYHIIKSFSEDMHNRRIRKFPAWEIEYYVVISKPITKEKNESLKKTKGDQLELFV